MILNVYLVVVVDVLVEGHGVEGCGVDMLVGLRRHVVFCEGLLQETGVGIVDLWDVVSVEMERVLGRRWGGKAKLMRSQWCDAPWADSSESLP